MFLLGVEHGAVSVESYTFSATLRPAPDDQRPGHCMGAHSGGADREQWWDSPRAGPGHQVPVAEAACCFVLAKRTEPPEKHMLAMQRCQEGERVALQVPLGSPAMRADTTILSNSSARIKPRSSAASRKVWCSPKALCAMAEALS